ncbi:hypothetical protein BD408DRAFT_419659 [Parasitella parasitica]|nr:hypothetical protein BD408DRAFT_419659 [Parasitella parasitica]
MFTLHICVRSKLSKEKEEMNLQHSVMYSAEFDKLGSIQNLKHFLKWPVYFCSECSY